MNAFGYSKETIIGENSLLSIYEEDHPKTREVVGLCFANPNTPNPVVIRKHFKEGVIRSNNWEFYGITNGKGEVTEILFVGFEITDLVRQNQEIKQLLDIQAVKNQKLQQHSYITSHNIRNSVANMLGLFELIDNDPEQSENYLDMLRISVEALNTTINNLYKLLNDEKKADLTKLENYKVNEALDRIIDLENFEINNTKAEIRLQCDREICIKTLPIFFDSVFHNLISNAIKYGLNEKSNVVDIIVEQEGHKLRIEVRDYGQGFDLPDNADILFKFGTRLNKVKKGQGIGLFITKHHAELIGATIDVDSTIGKGSSFKVGFEDVIYCDEEVN